VSEWARVVSKNWGEAGRVWASGSRLPPATYFLHSLTVSFSLGAFSETPATQAKASLATIITLLCVSRHIFLSRKKKQYSAIYHATGWSPEARDRNMSRPIRMQLEVWWLDTNFDLSSGNPLLDVLTVNPQCFAWNAYLESFKNRKSWFCSKFKAVKYHATEKLDRWNTLAWERFYFPFETKNKCFYDCHRLLPITEHH